MARHLVGASVAGDLDATLDRVLAGELDLADLHPSLAAWFWAGWNAGRASLAGRLEQAEDARDQLYEQLYNPGQQYPELVLRRLDEAASRWPEHADEADDFEAALNAATTPRRAA